MAHLKMTFSLDEATARWLAEAADRARLSKSAVVREAIREYGKRRDRLGEDERVQLLRDFDAFVAHVPKRDPGEAEAELAEIRESRRNWGTKWGDGDEEDGGAAS